MSDVPRSQTSHLQHRQFDDHPILTVQQHILQQQLRIPGASGEFSFLLSGITLATKMIQAQVRRAGLTDILGEHGDVNVQGEVQQKLDVYANQVLLHCLRVRDSVAILVSEENEEAIIARGDSPRAKYIVVFDPLDGSSNIDVNVSVGTTFSIMRRPDPATPTEGDEDVLQPGYEQVAAGYVVYGSSTILVYSAGQGVHGFTLDPAVGAFVLSHENIRMPKQGKYYSTNEAYWYGMKERDRNFIDRLRKGELGRTYSSRYIGSMVADFHRTLLKGGIFLYPTTAEQPDGNLRLLYEANPIAYLAEQAGGIAVDDDLKRILEIQPRNIHQRTPLIVGSPVEMNAYMENAGMPAG